MTQFRYYGPEGGMTQLRYNGLLEELTIERYNEKWLDATRFRIGTQLSQYQAAANWCYENIGNYGDKWLGLQSVDHDSLGGYGYAITYYILIQTQYQEDITLFKLRWL